MPHQTLIALPNLALRFAFDTADGNVTIIDDRTGGQTVYPVSATDAMHMAIDYIARYAEAHRGPFESNPGLYDRALADGDEEQPS